MLPAEFSSSTRGRTSQITTPEKLKRDRLWSRLGNVGAGTIQLLAAVALLVLILVGELNLKVGATQKFLTFDDSTKPPTTIPGVRILPSFNPTWLLLAMVTITAAKHFIVVLPNIFENYFELGRQGFNLYDWVEYSVTASLMMLILLLLTGVDEIVSVVPLSMYIGFVNLIGGLGIEWILWLQRRESRREFLPRTATVFYPVLVTTFMSLLPWVVFLVYFIVGSVESPSPAPWWLYGAFVGTFFSFNAFAFVFITQRFVECGRIKWKWLVNNPSIFQLFYISLSLFSKLNLTLFFAIGILTRSD